MFGLVKHGFNCKFLEAEISAKHFLVGQYWVVNILSSNQEIEETRCLCCLKAHSTRRNEGSVAPSAFQGKLHVTTYKTPGASPRHPTYANTRKITD